MSGSTFEQITRGLRQKEEGPLYLLDFTGMENSVKSIKEAFSSEFPKTKIAYSFKTNGLKAVTQLMRSLGLAAEVVSGAELEWAIQDKFEPENIFFDGPIKTKSELIHAARIGVNIQVDSLEEIASLNDMLDNENSKLSLSARLSVPYNTKYNSRFGFTKKELKEARQLLQSKGCDFKGIHIHIGSNINSLPRYKDAFLSCIDILREMWPTIKWLDIGGGFPANSCIREEGEKLLTYTDFAQCISKILKKNKLGMEGKDLIIEPGRCLVEDHGYLLAKVKVVKKRDERKIAITNAGLHLMKSMHSWYHPIRFLEKANASNRFSCYEVYGSNCFESDLLDEGLQGPEDLSEGDWLVIGSAGGYDMHNSNIWTRPSPPVFGYFGENSIIKLCEEQQNKDMRSIQLGF